MSKKIIVCVIIVLVPLFLKAQNTVSFFEEHIDFSIDSNFFSINGIYSFSNKSNEFVTKKIIFPFAANKNSIDSIKILNLNNSKLIHFVILDNAISFDLGLQPNDTLDVNIFYRQRKSIKNTYIITTTKSWGKALDKAIYTLTLPKDMKVDSFSYKPDSVSINFDKRLYVWNKFNFSPEFDFDIILK